LQRDSKGSAASFFFSFEVVFLTMLVVAVFVVARPQHRFIQWSPPSFSHRHFLAKNSLHQFLMQHLVFLSALDVFLAIEELRSFNPSLFTPRPGGQGRAVPEDEVSVLSRF
jgi:hypothetical protein